MHIDILPADVLKLILALCAGYPVRHVCRRWSVHGSRRLRIVCYLESLPMLNWARDNHAPFNEPILTHIPTHYYLNVMGRAHLDGPVSEMICPIAAQRNDVEMLIWGLKLHGEFYHSTAQIAAESGSLEILQQIYKGGVSRPDLVKWFRSADVAYFAAKHGHLHILEWLLKVGYGLTRTMVAGAIHGRHFSILDWLLSKGCPHGSSQTTRKAYGNGLTYDFRLTEQELSQVEHIFARHNTVFDRSEIM